MTNAVIVLFLDVGGVEIKKRHTASAGASSFHVSYLRDLLGCVNRVLVVEIWRTLERRLKKSDR
jgi:hypothetical protein